MSGSHLPLHRARGAWPAGITVIALALAGCGGGAPGFQAKANEICRATAAKSKAIPKPSNLAGVSSYLAHALPLAEQGLAKLKALTPPASNKAAYAGLLSNLEQQDALLRRTEAAVKARDPAKIQSIAQEGPRLNAQANAQAKSLGLTPCAKG